MGDQQELAKNTREFDLVFLDVETLIDLATSSRFYSSQTRPGGREAITIERSFVDFDIEQTGVLSNYRTLLFKPFPTPIISGVTDENAVAFENGKNCPPYWRYPQNFLLSQGINSADSIPIGISTIAAFTDQSRISKPQKIIQIIDPPLDKWIQFLAILLAILVAIFFIVRQFVKTDSDTIN